MGACGGFWDEDWRTYGIHTFYSRYLRDFRDYAPYVYFAVYPRVEQYSPYRHPLRSSSQLSAPTAFSSHRNAISLRVYGTSLDLFLRTVVERVVDWAHVGWPVSQVNQQAGFGLNGSPLHTVFAPSCRGALRTPQPVVCRERPVADFLVASVFLEVDLLPRLDQYQVREPRGF